MSIRLVKVTSSIEANVTVDAVGATVVDSVKNVSVVAGSWSGPSPTWAYGRTVPSLLSESLVSLHAPTNCCETTGRLPQLNDSGIVIANETSSV